MSVRRLSLLAALVPLAVLALLPATAPAALKIRVAKPIPKGRARLNCTMPARDGRWYWHWDPALAGEGVTA